MEDQAGTMKTQNTLAVDQKMLKLLLRNCDQLTEQTEAPAHLRALSFVSRVACDIGRTFSKGWTSDKAEHAAGEESHVTLFYLGIHLLKVGQRSRSLTRQNPFS